MKKLSLAKKLKKIQKQTSFYLFVLLVQITNKLQNLHGWNGIEFFYFSNVNGKLIIIIILLF